MDINICIDRLGLNANTYKLNQSNPPHNFTYWPDSNPDTQPTQEELEAAWTDYEAELASQEYARNRKAEYPSWQDQLDDIYHNGLDAWKATIKVTKDKYPKP